MRNKRTWEWTTRRWEADERTYLYRLAFLINFQAGREQKTVCLLPAKVNKNVNTANVMLTRQTEQNVLVLRLLIRWKNAKWFWVRSSGFSILRSAFWGIWTFSPHINFTSFSTAPFSRPAIFMDNSKIVYDNRTEPSGAGKAF